MHRVFRSVAAVIAIVGLPACRSNETMARQAFSSRFTCPDDRLTVTTRKDLDAAALAAPGKAPPSDVAADPGRLALWKKEEEGRAAQYKDATVLQVRGCEHEEFYVCGDLRVRVGVTQPGCRGVAYPPK